MNHKFKRLLIIDICIEIEIAIAICTENINIFFQNYKIRKLC